MLDQIHTLPFLEYSQWLRKCTIRNPDECAAIPECYSLQALLVVCDSMLPDNTLHDKGIPITL